MQVADFSSQNQAILSTINDLVMKLPYTTPVEIGIVFNELSNLRVDYDTFLATYQGNTKKKILKF